MKLTPVEILHHLGFQVPEEGVTIHPHDTFFHTSALQALGATVRLDAIPAQTLDAMTQGMAALSGRHPTAQMQSEDAHEALRGSIQALLTVHYKHSPVSQAPEPTGAPAA